MRMSAIFLPTLREDPADTVIVSHRLMFRAALLRKLANGLHTYLPLGLRAWRKVERIVREEMDRIGAQEIKPSVVVPAELWKESGRWETMGQGMLRLKNRTDAEFVVSPTAEEVFTHTVRENINSYRQLPITLYQINTKYRDEIRPRYGVMRGREFTMKDAYSFHTNDECLDHTYQDMRKAYRRIFKRCGLSVIPVQADTGAMGGTGSEEFMVESVIGDNTLILCHCGYAANNEKATCKPDWIEGGFAPEGTATATAVEKILTPGMGSIVDVSEFLGTNPRHFIKTLIYRCLNVELDLTDAPGCAKLKAEKTAPDAPAAYPEVFVAVCIRGDLDVNETKLAARMKASEVMLASEADVRRLTNAPVGFAGPVGFAACPVLADETVMHVHDAITGALEADTHLKHVEPQRDFTPWMVTDVRVVKADDACPECGKPVYETKGNELGHIFKLGYKYTRSMKLSVLDEQGRPLTPTMGCYGIGVDRTLASVIEEHHDGDGIIWPMSLAPFQVVVVPIKPEGEMLKVAESIYKELQDRGIEVVLDDRAERPGVKFKDADLVGFPVRIVVGDKHLPANVELKYRNAPEPQLVAADSVVDLVAKHVKAELSRLEA